MNPGKVEWNEENKPQPDMELLEQWISRQEDQMRRYCSIDQNPEHC